MTRFLHIAALLVGALLIGGVPGSVVRPLVLVLTAPPLPAATPDRDGVLLVRAHAPGGAIMAGVTVQAFAIVDGRGFAAGSAKGDASGVATIRGLPRGEHWVLADAPGKARGSSKLVLVGGERTVDLELADEHVVQVEVRDERGAPIAGAELEVSGGDPLPIGARTGAEGSAKVGRLGVAPWIVTARAAGYEEITQRGVREAGARITLRRLGALVVQVLAAGDGAPQAGAKVFVAGPTLWPARVAETTGAGTVRIGGLPAGSYALRATHGDSVSASDIAEPLARGEEKTVTLKLAPGVRVVARVESEDGEPVTGAHVTLAELGISPFPLEAATDKSGRAVLGPIARGPSSLAASAEGFVPRGAVNVPDPPQGEVKITLARAGALVGRVTDTRGFAVDGASIVVVGTDFEGAPIDEDPARTRFREAHFAATLGGPAPLLPMGELGVMPGPVPAIPHGVGVPSMGSALPTAGALAMAPAEPWVTRGDGTFRASPVSPGRVRVLVHHPQFTDALSDVVTLRSGSEGSIDVVMRRGGTLEGRVLDAGGRPVPGAHVAVAASRGTMEREARTAGDGTFAFASVPDDVTVSVARAEDSDPVARVAVAIPEGEKRTITITLPEPRAALDARVTDDRGYPVDAAQLTAQSIDPAAPLRVTAFTNARGEAKLANARGLSLRVEVRAPARAPKIVTVDAAAAGLMVVLAPAERAEGEVRAAHGRGEAIEGAEIVVYTELGARHATTDRAGAFALAELAAGSARFRVRAAGYAPKEATVVIDANGGARPTRVPRVELEGEGFAEGVVVDARGDPVQGARIAKDRVPVYLAVGATPSGVAVADARGHFRLGELAEGTCTLEFYAPNLGRQRLEGVRVIAGRAIDVGRVTLRKDDGPDEAAATRGGVAVTLGETNDGEVVLVAVAEASEAERAGLAPGDVAVEIDGLKVSTIAMARAKLSGPMGDDVVMTLRRADRTFTVRVPREEVRR